jgi:peptide/nickel transport system ATP-binding protein
MSDAGRGSRSNAVVDRGGDPLLRVRNLQKHYPITQGILRKEVGRVRAVDGISFDLYRGETIGLVGESGCGKSTAATSMLRLEEPTGGEVIFDGEDITTYDKDRLRKFRRRAQMIFQDPTSSFDPRMTIGQSVAEPLVIHGVKDAERRRRIVQNLLERVGLSPEDVDRYPHEFSGGQKQRVALARAMVVNPSLIVADEPTSALDVSIQSEILRLIEAMQAEFDLSIIFISHDMGVIREVCDRVAVMYLGEIVEIAPTEELFESPQHPYTKALLSSIPQPDPRERGARVPLKGDVPNPSNPPSGCRFHTRCPAVIQPEGYDFEQEDYVSLMSFRDKLQRGGVNVEAAREFASVELDVDEEEVGPAEVERALRDEYDLPETLDDPEAEEVLSSAFDAVVEEEFATAAERLADAFASPCESEHPDLLEVADDQAAACLLVEPRDATRDVSAAASGSQSTAASED